METTDEKMDMTNKEDLIEVLKGIIREYEDAIKWRDDKVPSIREIAEKTGTSYPTINNIKKGTIKHISNEMLANISAKLGGPRTIAEILELAGKKDSELSKKLLREYGPMSNYCHQTREFMEMALQEKYTLILQAAYSFSGTSEKEVIHNLGMVGKKNLDFLIGKGMVIRKNGRLFGRTQGVALADREYVLKCLRTLVRCYGENKDESVNRVGHQVKSVNQRFKKILVEKIEEIFKFINEEARKPENIGDEKVAIGMILYKFFENPDNYDNNDEKEIMQ